MLAGSIIKDFYVFEAGSLHFSMSRIPYALIALVLETIKPAFGWRVVPAVAFAFATHRTDHAKFFELVLKRMASVLTTAIRMMHDTDVWSAAKPSHRQRICNDVSCLAWLE